MDLLNSNNVLAEQSNFKFTNSFASVNITEFVTKVAMEQDEDEMIDGNLIESTTTPLSKVINYQRKVYLENIYMPENRMSRHSIICISGFLSEGADNVQDWNHLIDIGR